MSRFQVRHTPQQRERRDRELSPHVAEEPESGAGPHPHCLDLSPDLLGAGRHGNHVGTGRRVADDTQRQRKRQQSDSGSAAVGKSPARPGQQQHERERRHHLAQLTEDARELRDQRHLPGREPLRYQPQHRDEGECIPGTDGNTCTDRDGQRFGEGESQLRGHHDERTDCDHDPRTVAVKENSRRNLHTGVHDDLQHDEARQNAGRDREPISSRQTRDTERSAVKHGDHVGKNTDTPDQPHFFHRVCMLLLSFARLRT